MATSAKETWKQSFSKYLQSGQDSISILTCGNEGSGKSSLVNGLVGQQVAKEDMSPDRQHSSLVQEFTKVVLVPQEISPDKRSVTVKVWDTPGFGGIPDFGANTEADQATVKEISREADLILYCMDMRQRLAIERIGVMQLTKICGPKVWQKAVIALTFANEIRKPGSSSGDGAEYFTNLSSAWKEAIVKLLKKENVPHDIIKAIPIIPTGYHQTAPPDRHDWRSPFWEAAFHRTKDKAKPSLYLANIPRIRYAPNRPNPTPPVDIPLDKQREANEQSIDPTTETSAEQRATQAEQQAAEAQQRAEVAETRIQLLQHQITELEVRVREAEHGLTTMRSIIAERPHQVAVEEKPFWVMEKDEIELTSQKIGRGGWAEVKVAKFRGLRVAAKIPDDVILSDYNIYRFTREMTVAATIRHPNLVQFLGATNEGQPILLMELMPTSLEAVLQQKPLTTPQINRISTDVARALTYLHLMRPDPLVHRDISSGNILLEPVPNDTWKAKVSDYGSVNFVRRLSTCGPGNALYAAPEAVNPSQQSPKMDVYSYGVLLLQMCSHRQPDKAKHEEHLKRVQQPAMATLIRQCLEIPPERRPEMKTILNQFEQ